MALDYQIIPYQRDPVTRLAPPELKAVHPLGKSPVIEYDGRVIAESGAIIEYLTRVVAKGRLSCAEGDPDFVDYLHWMHYAEGSAMLPLLLRLYVSRLGEAGAPLHPRINSELNNCLSYMSAALGGRHFFVGTAFTAADVQLTFVLEAAAVSGTLSDYPKLATYLEEMHARPAYARAVQKGGPYTLGR